ncbi:MAG TPA: SdpI family protein [Caulobacteraceae bacterium]|nr:SdpI family protein [Caulobacteraceae bacterium]
MNLARPLILAAVLTAASVAIGAWAYIHLPAGAAFPINYGLDGRPHSYLPKAEGLGIMPAVAVLVLGIFATLPLRSRRLARSADAYGLLVIGLAALFLTAQAALIVQAIDPSFDVLRWIYLAAAVLLLLVGNILGKLRQNSVLGVRTRWTRADARVWDKTHRFAGRAMVAGALVLAAVALFVPDHRLLIAAFVLAVAGPLLASAAYSARLGAQPRS